MGWASYHCGFRHDAFLWVLRLQQHPAWETTEHSFLSHPLPVVSTRPPTPPQNLKGGLDGPAVSSGLGLRKGGHFVN